MKWLALALMTEGPTDLRFLRGVFYRQVLRLFSGRASQPIEVQEYVIPLDGREHTNDARIERICEAKDSFDVLGLHADASTSGQHAVRDNIVLPVVSGAGDRCNLDPARIVAILPAPEMEAWAMCDPDAIARCCGFSAWPTSRISAWPSSELERLRDPKDELNRAIAALSGGRRWRRDSGAAAIFDRLVVEIDLDQLSRLESFRRFSADLAASLRHLGYLDS